MSASNLHTVAHCQLAGSVYDSVTDNPIDPGISEIVAAADGGVYPTFAAVLRQVPVIPFSSLACGSLFSAIGLTGLALASGTPANFFLQKVDDGGTRAGATSHQKVAITFGRIVPRSIEASQGSPAILNVEAIAGGDGSNDPLIVTGSQSLPAGGGVSQMFTLGKFTHNGSEIDGVQSARIDFGVDLQFIHGGGDIAPTAIFIAGIAPRIVIQTLNASALSTLGETGSKVTSTAVVKFRKVEQGGTLVADATEEHLSFTVNEGRTTVTAIQNAHGSVVGTEIVVTPTDDDTNPILIFSATSTH